MAERKFSRLKNSTRSVTAAQARESVAQTIRQSSLMSRPNITDPIDYEEFVSQNKTILLNDPHRELLIIPADDVGAKRIERKIRTTKSVPSVGSRTVLLSGQQSFPSSSCGTGERKQSGSSSSTPTNEARSRSHSSATTISNNETFTGSSASGAVTCNNQHVRDCIESFTRDWNVIEYRYEQYSGSWLELHKLAKIYERLQDQVYEIDDDCDANGLEDSLNGLSLLTKEGYILKGSEAGTDSFLSVATKSFKKRWMSLRQELDGSCSLEFYKDSKKRESKGSINLDLCHQIVRNPKRGKYAFELRMIEGHKACILATESEPELEGWMDCLTKANSGKSETSSRKSIVVVDSDSSSISGSQATPPSTPKLGQSFRSQDLSRIPDLIKYSRETEASIAQQRRDQRVNVFSAYPDLLSRKGCYCQLKHNSSALVEPFRCKFGFRFLFTCERLHLNFQMLLENGVKTHVEPFFASAAVFHTKLGKITEEFRFDVNDEHMRSMICAPSESEFSDKEEEACRDFPKLWVTRPKSAIFSVQSASPDMFLVVRIEKVLTGSISSASDPYVKTSDAPKMAIKSHKAAKTTCQRMGAGNRMPFLWTARPLFTASKSLDTDAEFGAFYRQDSHKISDEEIVKHLNTIRGLDKPKNVTVIPGKLISKVEPIENQAESVLLSKCGNTVTCNYLPVEPFPVPPVQLATIEVTEFLVQNPRECFPFTEFLNLLYVHPKNLKYDCQKFFPKARNITLTIEYRESDDETATPLPVIFNRPSSGQTEDLVTSVSTNILHHNSSPDFYDEIKILLPLNLTEKHHVLFTLKHVSCSAKKKDSPVETDVGYAWIPIYPSKGRLNLQEVSIPVSSHLPGGYLSYKPLGLGRGFSGPEIKWIDSGREIFRVGFKLVSSIFPIDCNLHSFLFNSGKMLDFNSSSSGGGRGTADEDSSSLFNRSMSESTDPERGFSRFVQAQHGMPKVLKSLMDTDTGSAIRFFPVLMTQLLRMIVSTTSDDVQQGCLRMVIHILHQLREVRKEDIAVSYVEFFFTSESVQSANGKLNLHEELVRALVTLLKHSKDEFPLINNLIENSWFFFQLTIKSMANHLLSSGRIKKLRTERFPNEFQDQLMSYIEQFIQLIVDKNKELNAECKMANQNLAHFINRAFSLMDRGFVFKIIKAYFDKFHTAKDSVTLQQHKFELLAIVTSHEHHIPLNLPISFKSCSSHSSPSKFPSSLSPCKIQTTVTQAVIEEEEDDGDDDKSNGMEADGGVSGRGGRCSQRCISAEIPITSSSRSLEEETFLSDDFLKMHFTVGILLQETKSALSEVHQIRGMALQVLRNLLVKHSIDDRYQSGQCRIASLYFPFLSVILENINRIQVTGLTSMTAASFGSNSSQTCHAMVSKRVSFMEGISNSSPSNTLDSSTVSHIKQQFPRKNSAFELGMGQKKDSSYLQQIAGSIPLTSMTMNGHMEQLPNPEVVLLNSSDPDISSKSPSPDLVDAITQQNSQQQQEKSFHQRSLSLPVRFDKLNAAEGRDLLIIFAWIVKHVSEESLTKFLTKSSDQILVQFLNLHEMCLHEFRYNGRKDSKSKQAGDKAMTLPARIFDPSGSSEKANQVFSGLLEANLATEIGLITLDVIGIILKELSQRVSAESGENSLMKKIFSIFITLLRLGQSEILLKHLFASFRSFLVKFPDVLFAGTPSYVGELCFELLKCCSSRISSVRSESAAFLYLLMRANFNYREQFSMTRVHLQVIISVSKLLGDSNIVLLNNSRFQESLAIINNFSSSDKSVKESKFPAEVRELTKKIRTVLMATAAMREHEADPEMLMDLQCSLANSYAETSPALRRTWLESMAKNHKKEGNLSEAAQCFAHIAALESEILRKRLSASADGRRTACPRPSDFQHISVNIPRDEENAGCKSCDGSHGNEDHFSEAALIQTLESTAALFARAERFEVVPEVYKIMTPIHERHRNFEALAKIYKTVSATYDKIMQVQRGGKRILGRYYRVAFFGKDFFDEESGKEFVYKEPKVTTLPEISERLRDIFGKKFGHENIRLIMSEKEVDEKSDCDSKYAYIQLTHVHPYNHALEPNDRLTDFEKFDNNLSRFMFETPFSLSDPAKARSSSCNDQCKRRTILTTLYQFPYVVKRVPVISKKVQVLSPIEVAIDEMESRVRELEEVVVTSEKPDLKKLQLKLQGSVSVQVNAGPLTYARAFLPANSRDSHGHPFPAHKVLQLKSVFIDFTNVCEMALELNEKLIASDQREYQEALRNNFTDMVTELRLWIKERGDQESLRSPDIESDTDLTLSISSQNGDQLNGGSDFPSASRDTASSVSDGKDIPANRGAGCSIQVNVYPDD